MYSVIIKIHYFVSSSYIISINLLSMVGWVHNGRVNGDLGVSRSIGDIKFKAFNEHTLKQPLLSMQHTLGSGNTDSGIHAVEFDICVLLSCQFLPFNMQQLQIPPPCSNQGHRSGHRSMKAATVASGQTTSRLGRGDCPILNRSKRSTRQCQCRSSPSRISSIFLWRKTSSFLSSHQTASGTCSHVRR